MAHQIDTEVIEWRDGKRVRVVYRRAIIEVDGNTQTSIVEVSVEPLPDDIVYHLGPEEYKDHA